MDLGQVVVISGLAPVSTPVFYILDNYDYGFWSKPSLGQHFMFQIKFADQITRQTAGWMR